MSPLVIILSRNVRAYSSRRLAEALRREGSEVLLVNPLRCLLRLPAVVTGVVYGGRELPVPEVVVSRIGTLGADYGLSVLRQLEMVCARVLNCSQSVLLAKDKFSSLQRLAAGGLPVVPSMLVPTPAQVRRAVKLAGGLPVLVKLLRGSQGTGMVLCRSIAEAEAAVATIHALGWDVMVQKYITESWGEDVRLLVAGGELVAAMKRKARGDEFRSNIHRGGKALPFSPDREMIRIGIKATRLLGLDIAGVDLLLSRQGPLVLEVNPTPGFEGLQNVSSVNIAQQLAQFILSGTGCRRSRQQA